MGMKYSDWVRTLAEPALTDGDGFVVTGTTGDSYFLSLSNLHLQTFVMGFLGGTADGMVFGLGGPTYMTGFASGLVSQAAANAGMVVNTALGTIVMPSQGTEDSFWRVDLFALLSDIDDKDETMFLVANGNTMGDVILGSTWVANNMDTAGMGVGATRTLPRGETIRLGLQYTSVLVNPVTVVNSNLELTLVGSPSDFT